MAKSLGVAQFSGSPSLGRCPRIRRPRTELVIPSDCIVALTASRPTRSITRLVAVLSLTAISRRLCQPQTREAPPPRCCLGNTQAQLIQSVQIHEDSLPFDNERQRVGCRRRSGRSMDGGCLGPESTFKLQDSRLSVRHSACHAFPAWTEHSLGRWR